MSASSPAPSLALQRGQIYRVDLNPTQGSEQQGNARPCVILSVTPLNKQFRTVGIVPLSSSARAYAPVAVAVPSAGPTSVALCYQLRTIDKTRIGRFVGELSAADMVVLESGVKQVYGLA
jgi:mRNA interferase MazF